ncbi:MAG: hypothetical protein KBE24_02950 [Fusobacteriaceae bacterium]|jgi:hypothetical protein|nr:hypothetical protein [Fusobacteriaceae bacterium]MBU9916999.1 hypothetical protein [Fusobacteriaceae bacterium]
MDLLIVLALVFLESSVYVDFPYNVVSISVVGYLTSKYELYSLPYAILIGFIMGLSGYHVERPIIFLIIYLLIMNLVFKHLLFNKINIVFITLIEVTLYLVYIKYFELGVVSHINLIKEYIFVLIMNIVLLKSERD